MKKIVAAWTLAAMLVASSLAPIATDVFTDTNGTSLDAHTMTSGGLSWAETGTGVYEIQSNRATTSGADGWAFATVDASDSSVLVEADVTLPNTDDYVCGL